MAHNNTHSLVVLSMFSNADTSLSISLIMPSSSSQMYELLSYSPIICYSHSLLPLFASAHALFGRFMSLSLVCNTAVTNYSIMTWLELWLDTEKVFLQSCIFLSFHL